MDTLKKITDPNGPKYFITVSLSAVAAWRPSTPRSETRGYTISRGEYRESFILCPFCIMVLCVCSSRGYTISRGIRGVHCIVSNLYTVLLMKIGHNRIVNFDPVHWTQWFRIKPRTSISCSGSRGHQIYFFKWMFRGEGPEPVLLMPGALGSARSDFTPQLEQFSEVNGDRSTFNE